MKKIKKGDIVERLYGWWNNMKEGNIGEVIGITKTGPNKYSFAISGYGEGHDPRSFKVVDSAINKQQIDNYEMY